MKLLPPRRVSRGGPFNDPVTDVSPGGEFDRTRQFPHDARHRLAYARHMKTTSVLDRQLSWRQPNAMTRTWELRSRDGVIGLLKFPSLLRFEATGRIGDRAWRFVRKGFLTSKVEVWDDASGRRIAEYTGHFPGGSGSVALEDNQRLEAFNNFLLTEWSLRDRQDRTLLRIHNAGVFLHTSASVDLPASSPLLDANPWLILLGWYVLVLKHGDSA
jgi:hypothetical protein